MSLRAIARKLGVSSTTVSLALRDSPRVSPALTARIKQLAKAANYVPNARLSELMSEVQRGASPAFRAWLGIFTLYPERAPWRSHPHLKILIDESIVCARQHGYEAEYFWLKEPGLNPDRFRSILQARNIRGLFCLGSANPEEPFPTPLRDFAVVTFAASIPSKLHRVASHFAADATALFEQLLVRGYRRPGLCMLVHGDRRTAYAYSATYLSMCERHLPGARDLPILRADAWNAAAFDAWFTTYRPDAIVLHQDLPYIKGVEQCLRQHRLTVPGHIGLALLDKNPDCARYSGICQSIPRMATAAIELLISRMMIGDFHTPAYPKIELVVGDWNEGRTLRPPP